MRRLRQLAACAVLLMGASPAWAADAACSAPNVPMRPIMATHTIPPYPEVSVMTNELGTTLLEVHIGADGVPDTASVVNSSGSLRLDAAAADHVKSTWRWNAPVQNCQPMAVRTRVSIKWDLRDRPDNGFQPPTVNMDVKDYPPGARQRREQGAVSLMVMIAPNGTVTPVIYKSSGFPELDQKSQEIAATWRFAPATLDGRPVLTPVFMVSVWSSRSQKVKSTSRHIRAFLLAFCPAIFCAAPAAAQSSCALATVKISTTSDGRITIPVSLQDHPLSFLVDTGGVSTTIKWEQAKQLGLPVKQTVRILTGVGGSLLNFAVENEVFAIGELKVRNRPIYIESRGLVSADGTLAPDILRSYDVDFDLPHGSLSLMSNHCATGATAIAIEVAQNGHVRFPVKVDGKTIIATLDTGSAVSLIGMKAAALLGVYPNASELILLRDTGQYRLQAYPFQALEIGKVTVKNPHIVIASDSFVQGLGSDLVLGIDAMRQMHFTIAYGENRLYIAAPPAN